MKRFMSSSQQTASQPGDLLRAPRPPICLTKEFVINVGHWRELESMISKDKLQAKESVEVKQLMEEFEGSIEDALRTRGLLWEKPLSDEETRWLVFEYKRITGSHPRLFTTYGLMVHLKEMPRPYWRLFLDSLSDMKAIVILDWSTKLNTSVGMSMFDLGSTIPDHNMWCKGESDGSYDAKDGKGGAAKDVAVQNRATKVRKANLDPLEDTGNNFGPEEATKDGATGNNGATKVWKTNLGPIE